MALSADAIRPYRGTGPMQVETYSIATSLTVYVGSLAAFVSSTGRVRAAAAATGLRPAGYITEIVNESGTPITAATGNAAGTVKAKVAWGVEVLVNVRTAARTFTNIGKNVFIADDDNVTDTTAAGTTAVRVQIGRLEQFESSAKTQGWVALRVYGDASAV